MKIIDILVERSFAQDIQQHLSAARSALVTLKKSIVNKGMHKFEIEDELNSNRILQALGIKFEYTNDNRNTDFSEVGLGGGEYSQGNDIITVYYIDGFEDVLDDGYNYDAFVMKATETISHELTHRRQFKDRTQVYNPADGLEGRAYLSHLDEIQAFAKQVATELVNVTGYSTKEILQGLNVPYNTDKHLSTTLMQYLDEFEEGSKERKTFLKYLAMFLTTSEVTESDDTEIEAIAKLAGAGTKSLYHN